MTRLLHSTSLALLLHALHSPMAHAQAPQTATAASPASATAPSTPSATPVASTALATPSATPAMSANTPQHVPPTATAPLILADDGSEPEHWYGWQILTTDASAVTLFAMGAVDFEHEEEWFTAGALTAYLGGPIVHATHGNWGRAAGSLGLRIGAPILGALIGASMEDCSGGDFCGLAGGGVGFTLGAIAALSIDVAVLAYESDEPPPVVMPVVSVDKNGALLGAAGRF